MKKHVLTPLRRKEWERFCGFCGQQKKNKCVGFNKGGVNRLLLDTVKASMLACYGHTMRKQGSCLEKEIIQGTINNARCTQARKTTHSLDGRHQDVDRTPWNSQSEWQRTGINGESTSIVWPTLGSRTAKDQIRLTGHVIGRMRSGRVRIFNGNQGKTL